MSKVRKGYDNSKYFEEEAKLPLPDGKHCIICGKSLPPHKRKYCSEKCSNWSKGLTIHWSDVRNEVIERDKHTCQRCGKTEEQLRKELYSVLEVHHIKPIKEGGDEFNKINLITLCHNCHWEVHKELKKEGIE